MARNGWLIVPASLYEANKSDFLEIDGFEKATKTKNTVEIVYADYNNQDFRRTFLPLFDKFPDAPFNLSQEEAEGGYDFSSGVDSYIRPGKEQVDVYWNDNFLENVSLDELRKCSTFEQLQETIRKHEEAKPTDIEVEAELYNKNHRLHKYAPETKEELKALVDDDAINLGDIDTSKITDMSELFSETNRDDFTGIETWDVSHVKDMSYMFSDSTFNHPIDSWDVSHVKDMGYMFANSSFNKPIDSWDVSMVESMEHMFLSSEFNQPIESWNVSNVKDMAGMFAFSLYDQPLNSWDVSNVQNMYSMFSHSEFNQPLDKWDVSHVKDMGYMFAKSSFNKSIDSWDVSSVTSMVKMFADSVYNQPLADWDVSKVTNMSCMFDGAIFNQPIESWDVSSVKDMDGMFMNSAFNQPIEKWNVKNAENMSDMFFNADYSQNIDKWDIKDVTELGLKPQAKKVKSFEEALADLVKSHIEAGETLPDIGKQLKGATEKTMLELGKAHVAGKNGR
ncbi:BspA family leucine-rich repeat surface protein [Selenomonas ruminantium]|uniref:BspA family leucine-rich repeat surface protein n=1 Tax=Selenomonas ruminantium TaxID=971 RepID=UPI0026F17A9B|nr:BspA family leucine-rich repeat surface protein [Selenomonas ruminantium]